MSSEKKEHTIEERLELSMLYDFYGALLKDGQRRMFEASVLEDYNFSEIAQDEGITRQGAYDTVKRAIKQLEFYEEKLGLVARFREQKELAGKLRDKLREMGISDTGGTDDTDCTNSTNGTDSKMADIFKILEKILEE